MIDVLAINGLAFGFANLLENDLLRGLRGIRPSASVGFAIRITVGPIFAIAGSIRSPRLKRHLESGIRHRVRNCFHRNRV